MAVLPFAPKPYIIVSTNSICGLPVEFRRKQSVQLAKRSLIRRMIVTRHAVIFPVAHFPRVALPFTFEFYIGDFVDEKIRHARIRTSGFSS